MMFQNVVACAAGFSDGLGMGDNTKAAVIRLGLMEMTKVRRYVTKISFAIYFSSQRNETKKTHTQ